MPVRERECARSGQLVGRPDVLWWATLDEQVGQALQHVIRPQSPRHQDRQAAARELVDHARHPERPAVLGAVLHEVVRTDVVRPLRPQAHARAVIEAQAAPLRLFLRHLQPLPSPDPPHALDVHPLALVDPQPADPSIAVASVLLGQTLDGDRQPGIIVANPRTPPLRRPRLADNRTSATLRDRQSRAHVINARPLAGRAQYSPSRASFRINLSSVNSEIAFFRRWFFRSRSFRRRA
jgi:hypothetical protein